MTHSSVLARRASNGAIAFLFLTVLTCVTLAANSAHADFVGFGNFSQFKINQNDSGAAPTISIANDRILLTNGQAIGQARSIFHKTQQNISLGFTSSFTYQTSSGGAASNMGLAFVIQNSPSGFNALGGTWYEVGYGGIPNSIAIALELEESGRLGLFMNGTKGIAHGGVTSPVNLGLGNPIDVLVTYDGSILSSTLTDTVTNAVFGADFLIDIPAVIGSNAAFVGFTGSTGLDTGRRDQYVSHPTFVTNVPEPSSIVLTGLGALGILVAGRRRKNHRATARS